MPRQYDNSLLDAIVRNQYNEVVQGVQVLVKPIPEGGQDGDMDPRLYKSMKKATRMMAMMRLLPSRKPQTTLESILPLRKMFSDVKALPIAEEGVTVSHHQVASTDDYQVPVRVYHRDKQGTGLPVLVYYHGGGFFGGSPDVVEQMCKLLVQKLDCVVASVDYRLCPEHHYPQPLDDCWAATCWVHANAGRFGGDPAKLAVGGDSAGGNLAAVVALRDRAEATGMVQMQALLYPAVNIAGAHTKYYKGVHKERYRCSEKHGKVLRATFGMMDGMMGGSGETNMLDAVYLQGNLDTTHIYASPLLADLQQLPPTILIFGEHDFLVFEDWAYARALTEAGNKLKTVIYRGLGHGFADQTGIMPQAEDCMAEIASFMQTIFTQNTV